MPYIFLFFFLLFNLTALGESFTPSEKNIFGKKLTWQKVNNAVGELKRISFPLNSENIHEIKFGFAVKKLPKKNNMIAIFSIEGIFELRITNRNIYLQNNKTKKITILSKPVINKIFLFKFELDSKFKNISAIYLNGKKIKKNENLKWLSKNPRNEFIIYGATKSDTDFYFTKPVIVYESEPTNSITKNDAPWRVKPVFNGVNDKSTEGIFKAPWSPPSNIDIKLNAEYIAKKKFPLPFYFSSQELQKLPELIKTDLLARKFWEVYTAYAIKAVKAGGLDFKNIKPERYTYELYHGLTKLGFVHMASGNRELGKLLKALILDTAKRPIEFWIHSSLRKFNSSYPVAALECAGLARVLATAFHWNRDLFNESEKKIILDALRYKGFYPCMRWLEKNKGYNNWLTVIAAGSIASGRILGEESCVQYAKGKLKNWTTLVEDDGSYSESLSYFNYGAESFIGGALIFGGKKALEIVKGTSLKGSLNYLTYNYVKARTPLYGKHSYQVNFGDGDFPNFPNRTVCIYLTYAFKQGVGKWLMDEYCPRDGYYSLFAVVMKLMFKSTPVPSVSPEQLKLAKCIWFKNGVGFIRSGWKGISDKLLAIRSGNGGKTKYTHDHCNRNAILLFKDGEYMITESGRASYRSPMHYSWDIHTRSSNTVTFGDDSQKTRSAAEMIMSVENKDIGYLSSEAYKTYSDNYKIEKARRRVLFLKDIGSFVIWDDIISKKNMSTVNLRFFFNNFDGKTNIDKISDETLIVKRNNVDLKAFVKTSELEGYSLGKGWLHTGYSYNPGDPKEGKEGSSISWTCKNKGGGNQIAFYSYLGSPKYKVKCDDKKMFIYKGQIKYIISFLDNNMMVIKSVKNKIIFKLNINDESRTLNKNQ